MKLGKVILYVSLKNSHVFIRKFLYIRKFILKESFLSEHLLNTINFSVLHYTLSDVLEHIRTSHGLLYWHIKFVYLSYCIFQKTFFLLF